MTIIDRYVVIGKSIGHSKSPLLHGTFAKTTGQALEYVAIEGTVERFEAMVNESGALAPKA